MTALERQLETSQILVHSLSSANVELEILQSRHCCSQLQEKVSDLTSQVHKGNTIIFDLQSQNHHLSLDIMQLEEVRDFQIREEEDFLLYSPPSLEPLVKSLTIEKVVLSSLFLQCLEGLSYS